MTHDSWWHTPQFSRLTALWMLVLAFISGACLL
jgi:hypothetical protein